MGERGVVLEQRPLPPGRHEGGEPDQLRAQTKLGWMDLSETALFSEAFSLEAPKEGAPRLRLAEDDGFTESMPCRDRLPVRMATGADTGSFTRRGRRAHHMHSSGVGTDGYV